MLELINQLDGFDARGNIKVLMATNRPDTLDPALLRPGRLDRKIEFGPPDLDGRAHIFKIHARSMSTERDIRFELLARLCTATSTSLCLLLLLLLFVFVRIAQAQHGPHVCRVPYSSSRPCLWNDDWMLTGALATRCCTRCTAAGPNATGADIRSVCTEAGMYAIRARRKIATEKDFLDAVNKVIKGLAKFSSTARYMTYN